MLSIYQFLYPDVLCSLTEKDRCKSCNGNKVARDRKVLEVRSSNNRYFYYVCIFVTHTCNPSP